MAERPSYQPYRPCVKCDTNNEIREAYTEYKTRWASTELIDEWLQRTCTNCGYSWQEAIAKNAQ